MNIASRARNAAHRQSATQRTNDAMKTTIFFDLDGTLADTDADIRGAWKAALADLGIVCPNFDRDFVAGPTLEEMAFKLIPGCTDAMAQSIREGFGRHYDGDGFPATAEYPGVLDAVRELKARGARAYIATNKRFLGARAMAVRFGWFDVFDGLYTGDMHKDDPIGKLSKDRLLALAMRETGAAAADCAMVGDTLGDFTAAEANGIDSIGVAWGYGRPDELARATRIARSPADIIDFALSGRIRP